MDANDNVQLECTSSVSHQASNDIHSCKLPRVDSKMKVEFIKKLISLLFVRSVQFKDFLIGYNINGTEMFADIVLKIADKSDNKIMFLRIDISQNYGITLNAIDSDENINLSSCFKHVNTVKENYKSCRTLQDLGPFTEFEFIFYTKASFVTTNYLESSKHCFNAVLNTGKIEEVVYSIKDEEATKCLKELEKYQEFLCDLKCDHNLSEKTKQIDDFCENSELNEIKQRLQTLKGNLNLETLDNLYFEVKHLKDVTSHSSLLQKVKIYSQQANEEISELLQREILQKGKIYDFGLQVVRFCLENEIETWYKNTEYLLKDSDVYKRFISKLNNCSKMQTSLKEKISKEEIRFGSFSIKNVASCILQFRVLNVMSRGNDISLSCLKVYQVLEDVAPFNYLWISLNTLLNWEEDVFQIWFSGPCSILVIECETNHHLEEYFKNIVNEIAQILRMDMKKHVIVISKEKNEFTSYLKNVVFPDDFCEVKDTFRFQELDDKSQLKILNCEVQFQGHMISIGSLIGPSNDLRNSLSASVVTQLVLQKGSISIGPPLSECVSNYFPQTMELLVELDVSIIKTEMKSEVFFISGAALSTLFFNEDIQLYSEHQEVNSDNRLFFSDKIDCNQNFITFCQHFPDKNIHHLLIKKDSLFWRETKGKTIYLKDFFIFNENARHIWEIIESSKKSIFKPKTLLDSIERYSVILGDSGIGKSSLLRTLQKNTKLETPLLWLIHLNFSNDLKSILSTNDEGFDYEAILQTMYSLLHNEYHATEIEKILLRYEFEKRGNVIVMCEGLENVKDKYFDKVLSFIRTIDRMKVKKLWFASTPILKKILEKSFRSVMFEIQPLSSYDQVSFLNILWREKHDCNSHLLNEFILCLQNFLNTRTNQLMTLPLICVMITEVYQEQLTEYVSSVNVNWPTKQNIFEIYNRFVHQRITDIYESNGHKVINEIHKEQEEFFTNRHMLCALFSLLDITEIELLNISDKFEHLSSIVEEIKKYGIVEKLTFKRPVFFHKSFAEYFAAMWFSKNIEKSRGFLKKRMFDSNFRSILRFFDYFLIKGHELHTAVFSYDFKGVKNLLSYEFESNSTDKGSRTALHLAIIYSEFRPITCLLQGTERNYYNPCTKLLIENSTNTKMVDGVLLWRPFQYAVNLKRWDAMDLLLKDQIDFNDIDYFKERINDQLFVQEGLCIGSKNGYFNLINCFSSCGVNIHENVIETKEGLHSPLHLAAKNGQLKLVRYLLSKRVKVSIKNSKGISPLHLAASEGMTEVLVYLLQRGAELNCRDKEGNTPLHFAIFKKDLNMVILLTDQYDSNINMQNKFGDTSLHHAVKVGHATIIEHLLLKEVQIETCNQDGNTALHLAVWLGKLPAVQLLLEYGANVNACNKYGDTPLSRNAGGGSLDIVNILIENGAEVNKNNNDGNTAVHWAARQNSLKVLEYLLNQGADINVQNKYGNTPLHRAVEHGCLGATKYLINAGCNIQLQNNLGFTAMKMRSRSKEVTDSIASF